MVIDNSANVPLTFDDFRKFIAQVVREEIRALVAPEITAPAVNTLPKETKEVLPKTNNNWLVHSEAAAFLNLFEVAAALKTKVKELVDF